MARARANIFTSAFFELSCWLAGCVAAIGLFDLANAFKLTGAACYYGLALLSIVVFLFWLMFRRRATPSSPWQK
jgi:inner membrane protein involved in colicin E2 resistance